MQKYIQKFKESLLELKELINRNYLLKIFGFRLLLLVGIGGIILFILRNNPELKFKVQHAQFVYDFYKIIMYTSLYFLKAIGYNAYIFYSETIYKYGVYALGIEGSSYVFMGITCLGISLMGGFTALIIAFPGKLKHKLWFIPCGLIIIQLLNILRMSTLAILIHSGFTHTFEDFNLLGILKFNHHDLFNFFIYIVIFGMFVLYVNKFGINKYVDKKSYKG
jgi:exosortase/archaeosortase family protein